MAAQTPTTNNQPSATPIPSFNARLVELRKAGTVGVYADCADANQISRTIGTEQCHIPPEIAGNTTNQHFISAVFRNDPELRMKRKWLSEVEPLTRSGIKTSSAVYTVLCKQIGLQIAQTIVRRPWEINLPLRLDAYSDRVQAIRLCQYLTEKIPNVIIKISFAPHEPGFLVLARDLERQGVRVNITGMFSVRQAVAAAMLVDASRTSIFMGRINRGVGATFLGEHVILSAQQSLRHLRLQRLTKSHLIVSSVSEARSIAEIAGCDYITAPCETIRAFVEQCELRIVDSANQLEADYESRLGLNDKAINELGHERIARLYQLETEFFEFITELQSRFHHEGLDDPDRLFALFDKGGFGDLFYSPKTNEWRHLSSSRLPDLSSEITKRIPLDTLFSLLAFSHFKIAEENIDAEFE
jgi:transaldolase